MDNETKNMIETVILERIEFYNRKNYSHPLNINLYQLTDDIDGMIFELHACVYGRDTIVEKIKYPRDWFEAFKERFAPNWFLKHYPVIYQEFRFTQKELYPKIKVSGEVPWIHIQTNKRLIYG